VVLKAFVAGPTETDDFIPYHIIQAESILARDFVIRRTGLKMNKRERVASFGFGNSTFEATLPFRNSFNETDRFLANVRGWV
jgi:hypothetical protein